VNKVSLNYGTFLWIQVNDLSLIMSFDGKRPNKYSIHFKARKVSRLTMHYSHSCHQAIHFKGVYMSSRALIT